MIGQCTRSSCRRTGRCWLLDNLIKYSEATRDLNRESPERREENERATRVLRKGAIDIAEKSDCPNIPRR